MLDIVSTNPTLDLPTVNPTVQAILDIILTNASNGLPTLEADLDRFTADEIKAHLPAAKRLADKQVVREVGDDPCYETREQLLVRASGLTLGLFPGFPQVHECLRSHGLSNNQIADILPDLLACSYQAFVAKMLAERAQ